MDLTAKSFIRCFKRFISRRGLPTRIISDNGSTFKASAKILQEIFSNQEVKHFLSNSNIIRVLVGRILRAPYSIAEKVFEENGWMGQTDI